MNDNNVFNERYVLTLVASGDEKSFEVLYRHYRNKAYAIALTYMSSPAQAEDVLQDFFLQLWKNRATLTGIERFDQYLFIVLRNLLVSELRKKDRQSKIREHINRSAMLQTNPEQQSEAVNLQQIIQTALQQLPEKQQRIYQMSRGQGLSHEEIAAALQISPRTVSNTLSIVLNHLRTVLAQLGYLPETIIAASILFF